MKKVLLFFLVISLFIFNNLQAWNVNGNRQADLYIGNGTPGTTGLLNVDDIDVKMISLYPTYTSASTGQYIVNIFGGEITDDSTGIFYNLLPYFENKSTAATTGQMIGLKSAPAWLGGGTYDAHIAGRFNNEFYTTSGATTITNTTGLETNLRGGSQMDETMTLTNYRGLWINGADDTVSGLTGANGIFSGTAWYGVQISDFLDYKGTVAAMYGIWLDDIGKTMDDGTGTITARYGIVLDGDNDVTSYGVGNDLGASIILGATQNAAIMHDAAFGLNMIVGTGSTYDFQLISHDLNKTILAYEQSTDTVQLGYTGAKVNIRGQVYNTIQSSTCVENGSPSTLTITPTTAYNEITNQDAEGCNITLGETGINVGATVTFCIVSNAGGVVTFADTAGVTELAGAFAADIDDCITLRYGNTTTWREVSRSAN